MISQSTEHPPESNGIAALKSHAPAPSQHALSGHYAAVVNQLFSLQSKRGLDSFCVGVTSCRVGEGVTSVAINLALSASQSGARKVLLVDANQDHGNLAHAHQNQEGPIQQLRLEQGPGLAEFLSGAAALGDCIVAGTRDSMSVLGSGSPSRRTGINLDLDQLSRLLDELRAEYDLVVFDLPHAHELSECFALGSLLDGVLLVIEADAMNRDEARRVVDRLQRNGSEPLGVILNKTR